MVQVYYKICKGGKIVKQIPEAEHERVKALNNGVYPATIGENCGSYKIETAVNTNKPKTNKSCKSCGV